MKLTNKSNLPLSLAIWLAHDTYDKPNKPNTISATSLLKPIRAIVLAIQNQNLEKQGDVADLIPSRLGTAIHEAIELAWKEQQDVYDAMVNMGLPTDVAARVVVNPSDNPPAGSIVVRMEQRTEKEIEGFNISGKFDFIIDGQLEDFKSTGVYNWINGSNREQYIKQGSIYRWLNPMWITNDIMKIQYIFTDWKKLDAIKSKDYPQQRIKQEEYPLMSYEDTEAMIAEILYTVKSNLSKDQSALPRCTQEELWQRPTVWKYYKNPQKLERATKNFDNPADAHARMAADQSVGVVVEVRGEVKRCLYCNVCDVCNQATELQRSGLLIR